MHKIGVNINQIAKKVNTTGDLYPEEMKELKEMVKEIWRILEILPIKVTDKKALDYITNPDKTDEKLLVSSFGCSPETADLEFRHDTRNGKEERYG